MNFIPLHIYTGYSFLQSGVKIDSLISNVLKCQYKYVGISDINILYGLPKFYSKCIKNNIKPILGMELKIEDHIFSLYIKNEEGYRNLSFISSMMEKNKETKINEIKDRFKGLICVYSTKNVLFSTFDDTSFSHKLSLISSMFNDFFIGMEIYSKNDVVFANKIRNFSQTHNYKLIAFPLVKYLKKEDALVIDVLNAIKNQTTLDDNYKKYDGDFFFKDKEEITKFYTFEELENNFEIFKNINFNLNIKRGQLLKFSGINEDSTTLLKNKILEGLKIRNINLDNNQAYRDRLNYEFLTIKKMGYQDYFLIVQDYVKYAKNNNIPVGPGRGSSAGSLVAYLLEITEVDPLKYNLIFERFLNPNRKTLPDIDCDFGDVERDKIFSYITSKYGYNRSARVIAFQTFGAKQSLRDASRVLSLLPLGEELCRTIPNNYNKNKYDLKMAYNNIPAFKNKVLESVDYKEIFKIAFLLEGLPRQKGLHAAGIVVDNNDLFTSIPLTFLDENTLVTQYEKDYLEEQGFLKMDILGLSNLSIIKNCLTLIKQNKNIDVDLNKIDLNDKNIYKLITECRTMGIFQLDTSAAINAIKIIKPTSFDEVVATISIDRPGPMENMEPYARRKENKEKITYLDKRLIPILKDTYGIIIYQEQIMQIARKLALYSFSEADSFRRAISKKDHNTIKKIKDDFIARLIKNGMDAKKANEMYSTIEKFQDYGFPKAHAVSYALIGVMQSYLKTYYPLEFYLSILDQQYGSNDVKFNKYLDEIKKQGIEVLLPNINESTLRFKEFNNKLLLPLTGITSFPIKTIINVIEEREKNGKFESLQNFIYRMKNNDSNITSTQIAKLIDAGCFDSLNNNRKLLKMSVEEIIDSIDAFEMFNEIHEVSIKDVKDDPLERILNEYEALNVMISDNLLNYIDKSSIKDDEIKTISELDYKHPSTIIANVRNIKPITIKNGKDKGKPMAFISLYDNSMEIEGTIFASLYSLVGDKIKPNDIVIVNCMLEDRKGEATLKILDIKKGELLNE